MLVGVIRREKGFTGLGMGSGGRRLWCLISWQVDEGNGFAPGVTSLLFTTTLHV